MSFARVLTPSLVVSVLVLVNACSPDSATAPQTAAANTSTATGNPITGEGLPNPAPMVTANWGKLPE